MLCNPCAQAHDILQCSDDDARLYIGSTDAPSIKVMFTNLGNGHRTIVTATKDGDEVYVTPIDFVVDQRYKVEIVTNEITPVDFYPYEQTGYTPLPSSTLTSCVNFTAVKGYETDGDTYIGNDQWLTTY